MTYKVEDLAGQRFGRLVAAHHANPTPEGNNRRSPPWWVCECDCGGWRIVKAEKLKSGNTRSCGCLRRSSVRTEAGLVPLKR